MTIQDIISKHRPDLAPYEQLYKHFHANPELSFCEVNTAQTVVDHLSKHQPNGYKIVPKIGGTGVAAVLENGSGPVILLRADMDALPIKENTGLPYASKVQAKDKDGFDMPVMHACGHDMHTTALLAAADLLYAARSDWSGTLVLTFQPAEEKGAGAQAMVDDGLYQKHGIPVPDVAFGAHVTPERAGSVGLKAGPLACSADSYRVTFHGHGGHASQPHRVLDPVMMAAYAATRLNAIISRETPPDEMAVLTVPVIQAGQTENVFPDTAEMKIDMRAINPEVRTLLNESMKRVVKAESIASGAPEPTIERLRTFPITDNDGDVTKKLGTAFHQHFGDKCDHAASMMFSEDFSILASSVDRPYSFFIYGGTDPETYDKSVKEGTVKDLPSNHSSKYAPVIQPTLTTAVEGLTVAALTWLIK